MYGISITQAGLKVGGTNNKVVIKDGHGDKDILYGYDGQTDMSYWMDLTNMFFEYSLKIYNYS
jgi:hypothetical protein